MLTSRQSRAVVVAVVSVVECVCFSTLLVAATDTAVVSFAAVQSTYAVVVVVGTCPVVVVDSSYPVAADDAVAPTSVVASSAAAAENVAQF